MKRKRERKKKRKKEKKKERKRERKIDRQIDREGQTMRKKQGTRADSCFTQGKMVGRKQEREIKK